MVKRTPSLLWADLMPDHIQQLEAAEYRGDQEQVFAQLFNLHDYKSNERNGVLMDLYIYAINFAFSNHFTKEKTSTFFSILKLIHFNAMESPAMTLEDHFTFMKSLLVNHSVQRPPYSVQIFALEDINKITDYITNTYFRHLKMYQYVFTKKRVLNLKTGYVPIKEPPTIPLLSAGILVTSDNGTNEYSDIEAAQKVENSENVGTQSQNILQQSEEAPLPRHHFDDSTPRDDLSVPRAGLLAITPSSKERDALFGKDAVAAVLEKNLLTSDLTKEIHALANAAVVAQFERLKTEFDKKLKVHEAILSEKLEMLEARSRSLKLKK